jgi:adenylate cyclase class 2
VDSRGEVEEARDRAEGILERLGLDPEAGIRTSYLGMVLAEDAQE